MEEAHLATADRARSRVELDAHHPAQFRAALLSVPPVDRDAWIDRVLGLDEIPDDGPDLPRGCVPYFPCSVDAVLRMVDEARVAEADVFVDIGAGLGRASVLVHLLTGARAVGVEIQPDLVHSARALAARLATPRVSCVEGDAAKLTGVLDIGTVFFLYCPFSGDRLATVLAELEVIARARTIRVCCVDLPLPPCSWLALQPQRSGDLGIYLTT